MSNSDNNFSQIGYVDQDEQKSSFSFRNFFHRCVRNWPWFLASIFVCLGIAFFYILRTQPMYTRSATVLIKEGAARRMASSDIESMISFSGGGSMSSKVVNEVIVFQSPAIMQEVVRRLDLTIDYFSPSLFRNNVIYGVKVPVSVEFINDVDENVINFNISKGKDTDYVVGALDGPDIKANFGDTLSVGTGRIVITRNKLYPDSEPWTKSIIVKHYAMDSATAMYCSRFSAESGDIKNHADVLSLKFQDWSVQRADDVLNTLICVYNESWIEDKNKMAVSTSNFIEDRIKDLEKELGEVDNLIMNIKSDNLIPDVGVASELYINQTKEVEKARQQLDVELSTYRYIQNYLLSNKGIETLVPIINVGNGSISSQITDYNKTMLNRNNIRANSSANNPIVKDLDASLVETRMAIEQAIENQIGTVTSQIEAIDNVKKSNEKKITRNTSQEKDIVSIKRKQKVLEQQYLYLLQKREENALSRAFSADNNRVVTPPMGNAVPSSPKKTRILLIALLLGFFIPLIVIYVIEVSNNKINSRQDLTSLSLPFLGEVPLYLHGKAKGFKKFLRHREDEHTEVVVKPGRRNVVNEAFRVIRTNLEFMERGHRCPVIITCSFNPGSGKTFLSINISAALAIKNNKVLVIDGDLRRASLSKYVSSPGRGISDFLTGAETDIHRVIVPVKGFDKLDVLPVGTIPPNPSELVSQPTFPKMIEALREEYDYIFIDCPPVDIVADTRIIEECSDRTIFVIRAGVLDRKDVPNLQKAYDEKRFKNLCYIFNGVDTEVSYYGHYGNYGGRYGSKKESYYGSK